MEFNFELPALEPFHQRPQASWSRDDKIELSAGICVDITIETSHAALALGLCSWHKHKGLEEIHPKNLENSLRKVNESLKDAKEMLLETGRKRLHHGQNFGKIIARDNTENRQLTQQSSIFAWVYFYTEYRKYKLTSSCFP